MDNERTPTDDERETLYSALEVVSELAAANRGPRRDQQNNWDRVAVALERALTDGA